MKILIKGGRVIDPANNIDKIADVLIEDGKIVKVATNIKNAADEVVEAAEKIVCPGLIDMHVHLREPGQDSRFMLITRKRILLRVNVLNVALKNRIAVSVTATTVWIIVIVVRWLKAAATVAMLKVVGTTTAMTVPVG